MEISHHLQVFSKHLCKLIHSRISSRPNNVGLTEILDLLTYPFAITLVLIDNSNTDFVNTRKTVIMLVYTGSRLFINVKISVYTYLKFTWCIITIWGI